MSSVKRTQLSPIRWLFIAEQLVVLSLFFVILGIGHRTFAGILPAFLMFCNFFLTPKDALYPFRTRWAYFWILMGFAILYYWVIGIHARARTPLDWTLDSATLGLFIVAVATAMRIAKSEDLVKRAHE